MRAKLISLLLLTALTLSSCQSLDYVDSKGLGSENNLLPTDFTFENTSDDLPIKNQFHGDVFEDDCIYYDDGNTIVRYNIKTNNRTYVCTDPICTHDGDSDCPLFGAIDGQHYYNGKWYALKDEFVDGSHYRYYSCYDPETGEAKRFAQSETNLDGYVNVSSQVYYDNYLYYYNVHYEEGKDGEADRYGFILRRVSLDGGEPETIMEFDNDGSMYGYDYLLFADDGKLYLCEVSKGIYYISLDESEHIEKQYVYLSDDPQFGMLLECCQLIDGILYIGEGIMNDEGYDSGTVYYKVDANGKRTDIATVSGVAYKTFFTNQYIYFLKTEGTRTIGFLQSDRPEEEGNIELEVVKIYRMDYEGNVEKVFDGFPDTDPYATCCIGGDFTVVGNYLYIRYRHWGAEKKEFYTIDNSTGYLSGLMRLDISTGDIIYVSGS